MNKHAVGSIGMLLVFTILFGVMMSGVRFGGFGKVYLALLFLVPLTGAIFGWYSRNRVVKWLLIVLNMTAVVIIGYLLLLAYGLSES